MICAAAAMRLVPHVDNFTPVLAIALFAGAQMRSRGRAIAIPLLAMLASDIGLQLLHGNGFYPLMPVVYGTIAAIALSGRLLRDRAHAAPVLGSAIAASCTFFLVTNLAVWRTGGLYPQTVPGLLGCFASAVPFFRNTLAGTIAYSVALFGGYELLSRRLASRGEA